MSIELITNERRLALLRAIEDAPRDGCTLFQISDLRALDARITAAEKERDMWKANHDNQVAIRRAAITNRQDLPMADHERNALVEALAVAEKERDELREKLAAFDARASEWEALKTQSLQLSAMVLGLTNAGWDLLNAKRDAEACAKLLMDALHKIAMGNVEADEDDPDAWILDNQEIARAAIAAAPWAKL